LLDDLLCGHEIVPDVRRERKNLAQVPHLVCEIEAVDSVELHKGIR
jgi:hypothetical protein